MSFKEELLIQYARARIRWLMSMAKHVWSTTLSIAGYLFLEQYTGRGASEHEFVEFFKTKGITVVFSRDVENIDIDEVKNKLSNFMLSSL